jgi:hypothetical protein
MRTLWTFLCIEDHSMYVATTHLISVDNMIAINQHIEPRHICNVLKTQQSSGSGCKSKTERGREEDTEEVKCGQMGDG